MSERDMAERVARRTVPARQQPQRWSTTEDPRPAEGEEVLHVVGVFGFGGAFGAGIEHSADDRCCQPIWGFVFGTNQKVRLHGVEFPHPWPGVDEG
jgi:hypothetical protein